MKYISILTLLIGFNISLSQAQSVVAKREFNNTLKAYFEAKNALSKDQVEAAELASQKLIKVISEFPVKTLSESQQALWKKESAIILSGAKELVGEKDLKSQRKPFEGISNAMYNLTKEFNMHSQAVYWQYCPMVKKSWLNEVEAVQNPYYGSRMYACGEVKETLATP
ncbi:MAG: DUF3347 domain-containing protein [Pedobacter sp.]|nr:MAG: DUF3347 domain-containing protein [Pedobacter sp.]